MSALGTIYANLRDEVEGAKCYAKLAVEHKTNGNSKLASTFASMAADELKHAEQLQSIAEDVLKNGASGETLNEMFWDLVNQNREMVAEGLASAKEMVAKSKGG